MSTVRQAAAWTCRVLIALFAAAVNVEVFVATSVPRRPGVARGPADPSRTASAHCASTDARCVDAGPGTGTERAGPVRRLGP